MEDRPMGNFSVKFGIDANYFDPDYRALYVKAIGETTVSVDGRDGASESDQVFIKDLVTMGLNKALTDLSSQNVSIKDLPMKSEVIKAAVNEAFAERKVAASSFALISINPDERSRERMNKIDEMKRISSMSPEEVAKMQQEAARKAQERWDSLSPEEQQRIQEESKKKAEEAMEKMKKIQEMAAALSSDAPLKKFCSNCGAPAKGGKFCGECGKPL